MNNLDELDFRKNSQAEVIAKLNNLKPKELQEIVELTPQIIRPKSLQLAPVISYDVTVAQMERGHISIIHSPKGIFNLILNDFDKGIFFQYSLQQKKATGKWKSYGIGTIAQAKILIEAYKHFTNALVAEIEPFAPSGYRRKHLKQLDIDSDKETPFPTYFVKTMNYLNRNGFQFTIPKEIQEVATIYDFSTDLLYN